MPSELHCIFRRLRWQLLPGATNPEFNLSSSVFSRMVLCGNFLLCSWSFASTSSLAIMRMECTLTTLDPWVGHAIVSKCTIWMTMTATMFLIMIYTSCNPIVEIQLELRISSSVGQKKLIGHTTWTCKPCLQLSDDYSIQSNIYLYVLLQAQNLTTVLMSWAI